MNVYSVKEVDGAMTPILFSTREKAETQIALWQEEDRFYGYEPLNYIIEEIEVR